jgi:hypothetical protein
MRENALSSNPRAKIEKARIFRLDMVEHCGRRTHADVGNWNEKPCDTSC